MFEQIVMSNAVKNEFKKIKKDAANILLSYRRQKPIFANKTDIFIHD